MNFLTVNFSVTASEFARIRTQIHVLRHRFHEWNLELVFHDVTKINRITLTEDTGTTENINNPEVLITLDIPCHSPPCLTVGVIYSFA